MIMKQRYDIKVRFSRDRIFSLVWDLEKATHSAVLEKVFAAFNAGSGQECDVFLADTEGQKARHVRSLSVGDYVSVNDYWYKCESMGWSPTDISLITKAEDIKCVAYVASHFFIN